jgi:hypothetical protein
MTGYAPAGKMGSFSCQKSNSSRSLGYIANNTQFVRGFSPLHDSGTGSSGLAVTQIHDPQADAGLSRELRKL